MVHSVDPTNGAGGLPRTEADVPAVRSTPTAGATRQSGRPELEAMRGAAVEGRQSSRPTCQVDGSIDFLGMNVARFRKLGYSDQQTHNILAADPSGEVLENLGEAHTIVSPAFSKRELPILRRQLTEIACGANGAAELSDISVDWKTLRRGQFSDRQLKEVFMYHGLPGLRSLFAVNGKITGDLLAENTPVVRARVVEIGADENGVQTLWAMAQHWDALRLRSKADEILTLAGVSNASEILSAWANAIVDKNERSA